MRANLEALLLGLLTASSAVAADEQQTAAPQDTAGSQDVRDVGNVGVINEIIVTATRRNERLQDVPIAISAIDAEALEKLSASSFADYARTVPGVSFVDLGSGRQKVAIRGINVTGGQPTVGYYVGDAPIPATAGTIRLTNIDPAVVDLERVEILRGPQGTLYGNGAMGGAVRFIPRAPNLVDIEGSAELIGTLLTGGGVGSEIRGVFNVPLVSEHLAARIAVWHRDQDGFIDRRWGKDLSLPDPVQQSINVSKDEPQENTSGARGALLFRANDAIDLEAAVYHQDQQFSGFQHVIAGPSNPTGDLVQNQFGDVAEPQSNNFTLTTLTARGQHPALSWTISASRAIGVQETVEDSTEPELFTFGDTTNIVLGTIEEWNKFTNDSVEARITSARPLYNFDYVIGGFYEHTERSRTVDETNPGWISASLGPLPAVIFRFDFPANFDQTRKAPFAEINYHIGPAFTITGGVRRDTVSASVDAQRISGFDPFSPDLMFAVDIPADPGISVSKTVTKFSGAWKLNDRVMLYATRSEGFRVGSLSRATAQLVQQTCRQQAIEAGLDPDGRVGPDSVTNSELGLKSTWAGGVTLNASVYNIDWDDLQQTVFLPCGSRLSANAGSARSRGVELEFSAPITDRLVVGLSGALSEAEITDPSLGRARRGDRIQQVPEWTATTYLEWELPRSENLDSHFRLEYQGIGSSYNDFVKALPPEQRATQKLGQLGLLSARLWAVHGPWQVALYGQNLLNDVEFVGFAEAVSIDVPGRPRYSVNRPRTFGLSVSRRF